MSTYVHLLDDRVDDPLDLAAELRGGNDEATPATDTDGNDPANVDEELRTITREAGEPAATG
jgi:hypothetical protein